MNKVTQTDTLKLRRIQKIVLWGGVWDAVDTSPDLAGQNVVKTFEMAIRRNTRTTETKV